MIRGFDVSAYQGGTVPACDFVFVKATEGASYVSARFDAQWASAKSRAQVRGAYHFARPEQSSAQHQADRLIALARPVPGEMLCLDLEASGLGQAATNAWAKAFGQRLRERCPGVTTVLYMGSGYAGSDTGRDLAAHFSLWWYPQYPSAYQIIPGTDLEEARAANRTNATFGRFPIAASTSKWPPAVTPWLPTGLTCGWKAPHIWQFTDNFGGLDANVSPLTLEQLAGGGQKPTPSEEIDMIARDVKPGMDAKTEFPLAPGKFTTLVAGTDNSYANTVVKATAPVQLRVRVLHTDGTWQAWEPTVGRATTDKTTKVATVAIADPAHAVLVTVTRMTGDGTEPLTIGAY